LDPLFYGLFFGHRLFHLKTGFDRRLFYLGRNDLCCLDDRFDELWFLRLRGGFGCRFGLRFGLALPLWGRFFLGAGLGRGLLHFHRGGLYGLAGLLDRLCCLGLGFSPLIFLDGRLGDLLGFLLLDRLHRGLATFGRFLVRRTRDIADCRDAFAHG